MSESVMLVPEITCVAPLSLGMYVFYYVWRLDWFGNLRGATNSSSESRLVKSMLSLCLITLGFGSLGCWLD